NALQQLLAHAMQPLVETGHGASALFGDVVNVLIRLVSLHEEAALLRSDLLHAMIEGLPLTTEFGLVGDGIAGKLFDNLFVEYETIAPLIAQPAKNLVASHTKGPRFEMIGIFEQVKLL